jgi:hypothetical protein
MAGDGWPLVDQNDDGIRPAGKPDQCFYCSKLVGQPHQHDCVIVTKRVKVRYTYELEIEVPHSWTKENVEFQLNDSSWCADNGIEDLIAHRDRADNDFCLCDGFKGEFLDTADETPRRALREDKSVA